jgi:hypothetical protein
MGRDKILGRIERETGVADLVALLAERLEPADLHSLLLEVYRRRASFAKDLQLRVPLMPTLVDLITTRARLLS